MIMIDEAEERTSGFPDNILRTVLRNLLRIHNNLYQDPQFRRIVFILAGTRDLWQDVIRMDEPVRQRYETRKCDLPPLSGDQYISLGRNVIEAYDMAFGSDLSSRISGGDLTQLVVDVTEVKGKLSEVTPREFLFSLPDPDRALMNRLDAMRDNEGLSLIP